MNEQQSEFVISKSKLMDYVKESALFILNREQILSEIESKVNSGLSSIQVDKLNSDLNRLYGSVLIQLAAASPISIEKIITFDRDVLIGSKSNYSLNCGPEILQEFGLMLTSFPIPDIVADSCANGFFISSDCPKLLCCPYYDVNDGGNLYFLEPAEFSINRAISIQIKKRTLTSTGVPDNYFKAIQAVVKSLGAPW
ncbi:MAG: hypothetical protein HRU38_10835 [Saccharospirillaceae bacterium]|nr:hypothetical protein [Saccharospirillaceae bacterium]